MKERITITLDKNILEWIDAKVEEKIFANRSHGFEYLIARMQRLESQRNNSDKVGK